ncbi:paramyosin-like [Juglans regia]|uniref:Paramyosin-like n=2 Tax=Juglans regia TaxID=51240 RepID=A0A2I4E931_JUGRE|nr:paramyosin-like [Juglans regia]
MAKKKVAPQAKDHVEEAPQSQDGSQSHNNQAKPMHDLAEKLQSLKSLNSLLLKETSERRQQVESLEQAKETLQVELARSGEEMNVLEAELTRASEESFALELERSVICVFMETQIGELGAGFDGLVREKAEIEEMKREREAEIGFLKKEVNELIANLENERNGLSRLCLERDLLKKEIDCVAKEANGLREKVVEMERKERTTLGEIEKLQMESEGLLKEKLEMENAAKSLKREKESVERNLDESIRVTESLRSDIERALREKGEVERERSVQELNIGELEKKVRELNEIVTNLRADEEVLRLKVFEFEKRIAEATDKEKEMTLEINVLVEEKRKTEQKIEDLKEERGSVQRVLDATTKESEARQHRIQELIRERDEIVELKLKRESEIVELNEEDGRLRNVISTLRESCRHEEEKKKQLMSEVTQYRDALDRVTLERDEMQKGFYEENKKVKNMEALVSEKERGIQEAVEELGRMKSENENLMERNKAMENNLEVLVKEKDLVQKNLVEAQRGIDESMAKTESAGINTKRVLSMVKNTAAWVCQSQDHMDGKKEVVINEKNIEEEIQAYVVELDAIKSAFRNKEKTVEEMRKQLEFLQNSVVEANKKKSFWTVVSSATTIFAAASVAYVARGR